MKLFIVFVFIAAVTSENENDTSFNITANYTVSRKHYGLSFNNRCPKPRVVFKCMTTCKSIGFQIFRLDSRCRCSCHSLKTTTILPFFKWRTNGTTKTMGTTHPPRIYDIYGPMFHGLTPRINIVPNETFVENITCPPWPGNVSAGNDSNGTGDANGTGDDAADTSDGDAGGDATPADGGGNSSDDAPPEDDGDATEAPER